MQSRSWIALRSRPEIAFAALLIVLTGGLMLGVGLGPNVLPYPLQSTFSDAAITHWPNALFFQQSVRAGYWPLWNNLLMSGIPFAADPLSKVWYPPQWLAIILPVATHLNLMIWLHLILAGLGMRALCRRLGQSDAASSICGLAYALTPRLLAATGAGHLDIVYAEAWFPWVLWAVDYAISAPASVRIRAVVVGCIGALSLLADLRISVFSFAFGAAYAVWRTSKEDANRKRSVAATLLFGFVLVVGLTAVQWIPLAALLSALSRGDLTAQGAAVYSLQPAQMIGLLYPDRFGFHETMVYIGIAVLALAIIGFAQNPRRHLFWLLIMLMAGWYALGDQGILWPALARVIPGVVWLRVPSRAWIVVVVGLIVLAGAGIDAILEQQNVRGTGASRLGFALFLCGLLFGFAGANLPLRPGAGIEAALSLLFLGVVLMFGRYIPIISLIENREDAASDKSSLGNRSDADSHKSIAVTLTRTRLAIAIGAVILLDLLWMDISLVRGVPQSAWLDSAAPLAEKLQSMNVTRLYSPDYALSQQAAFFWHIPQFSGVDPFQLRDYVSAFEQATGTHTDSYSVTLPPFDNVTGDDLRAANQAAIPDVHALASWNVSHVVSAYPIQANGLELVSTDQQLFWYANILLSHDISVRWSGPNHFTAINQGSTPVKVAACAPGWNIPCADGAIVVQPRQTLDAAYDPPGLTAGLTISLLSVVVVIAALATARSARKTHG